MTRSPVRVLASWYDDLGAEIGTEIGPWHASPSEDFGPLGHIVEAPEEAESVRIAFQVSASGPTWIDDARLATPPRGSNAPLDGRVRGEPGGLVQHTVLHDMGLEVETRYRGMSHGVVVEVHMEDVLGEDRALDLSWSLPVAPEGLSFHSSPVRSEPVTTFNPWGEYRHLEHGHAVPFGHGIASEHGLSSVSSPEAGWPWACPRQTRDPLASSCAPPLEAG